MNEPSLFYRFTRGLIRASLRFYYRQVEVAGAETIPAEGPLLLLANHHNGMIDPLIVIAASPRAVRYIAKEPLFRIPVLGWYMRQMGSIPAHRTQDPGYSKEKNDSLFVAAKDAFLEGGTIGIFPEGGSHVDPGLAEFKHGAAKMALEAEARADFKLGLRAQLVAIHFERTRMFRGRVLVTFGPTQPVAGYRERFAADPRGAVAGLTRDLRSKLSAMILDAENAEVAHLTAVVERIMRSEGPTPGLEERLQRRKAVLERYRSHRERRPEKVESVRRLVTRYDRIVRLTGSGDGQIAASRSWPRVLWPAFKNTLLLVLGAPVFAYGLAFHAIPYLVARACARFRDREEDHRSSVGLLVAIALFPLWYAALAVAGWRTLPAHAWLPLLLLGPPSGFVALAWLDRFEKFARETAGLWLGLTGARGRLARMRREIVKRIETLEGE